MTDPHQPRIEGDRLYGRGAYDMKASVAASLIACREAASLDLAGDVVVAAVADEEHASLGVQEVLTVVEADAAIVTEPTEMALVVAHRGFAWFEVEVTGRAAHGSRPQLGVDAIVKMGPILTALGRLDEELQRARTSAAGAAVRPRLADRRRRGALQLPRALRPRRRAADIARRDGGGARGGARGLARRVPCRGRQAGGVGAHAARARSVRDRRDAPRRSASSRTPSLPRSEAHHGSRARATGRTPRSSVAAGIPTVMFGPSGAGAHELEEWVSLSDTAAVAQVLVDVARRVCA